MHVGSLSLRDFRSYADAVMTFDPGVSTLLGSNGQGKTNVVEAVHYLATLSSHRVATDAPLVRAGASRATVAARLHDGDRSLSLDVAITPGAANKARVNRSPVRSTREVLGLLRVVLFAPEDLAIVKGDPAERRRFLDTLMVQLRPRLGGVKADYDRVLKQRSALLRSASAMRRQAGRGSVDLATLDVWDGHAARTGAELAAARWDLVRLLRSPVDEAYLALAPNSAPVTAAYVASVSAHGVDETRCEAAGSDVPAWERLLLEAFTESRPAELERGQCLVGPHRDDVLLRLGDLPARGYASQGESWSLALALRLASYDLLIAESSSPPVLMLDDVFAELDSRRRAHLAERLRDADQVLVTAAVAADVPDGLGGARFTVQAGSVTREQ
jgi:DNA replication and repair protein RecF